MLTVTVIPIYPEIRMTFYHNPSNRYLSLESEVVNSILVFINPEVQFI